MGEVARLQTQQISLPPQVRAKDYGCAVLRCAVVNGC